MKILGYDYRLVFDTKHDQMGAYGRIHFDQLLIQIANDVSPQQVESTVLHEVIEALKYHLGLEIDHQTIMSLESTLYQVLIDNGIDLSPLTGELQTESRRL